jgi:hypothetical protein
MKHPAIALLAAAALLGGCTVSRGDCEFMLQTERERCLHANASSEQALKERAAASRKQEKPFTLQRGKADEAQSASPAP